MADTPETSEAPVAPAPAPVKKKRNKILIVLLVLILLPAVIFALWVWVALGYTYSTGERAGYVQKISKKGWLCKTWEGEIAMANLPGTMPQIFSFTVQNDSIAHLIEQNAGKQLSLTYEQHRGVPTTCFGETEYFVTRVHRIGP
jgi:DNA-binding transcriptional regulator of glucitol operon